MINIKGLNKIEILMVLYNASMPMGMGWMNHEMKDMTYDEANEILDKSESKYFDYLKGRVMKINLSKDEFNEVLYDRDNGPGMAARQIDRLRK